MKAVFEDINSRKGLHSFHAFQYSVPFFKFNWHYHPEYELTLITSGSGERMVGDSYENFSSGDLVLLGPHLPHTWVSKKEKGSNAAAIVIQFSPQFIHHFFEFHECSALKKTLNSSGQGLLFQNKDDAINEEIVKLLNKEGVEKITGLLTILDQLAKTKCSKLASSFFQPRMGKESETRINAIFQYLQKHAAEAVSLQNAAGLIHLSDSAFCKFFKRTTGKTFSDYVNEIRIGHACSLLTESDKTIAQIAYQTGFESITYFNRVFIKKKKMTPSAFRIVNSKV